MAYTDNELFASVTVGNNQLRVSPRHIEPKTFAPVSGGATLERLTPVAFDTVLEKWLAWTNTDGLNEVQTVTIDATGGTFTLSFGGETTGALAWNISAAALLAALEALEGIEVGDLTVTLDTLVYTITFGGSNAKKDVPVLVADAGSLTGGGSTATVAVSVAGTVSTGRSEIRGFVWPDEIVLDDSGDGNEDVLGQVLTEGLVHYDDIVLVAGEDEDVLKEALRSGPRALGLVIQGLDKVR